MRKEILWIGLVGVISLDGASLSHKEISSMVDEIKKERSGIDIRRLKNTPNPFAIYHKPKVVLPEIVEETPEVEEEEVETFDHQLLAILNHAAFIDGKWYKVGDTLGEYTLVSMGKDQVVLKRGSQKRTLAIPKLKKKFILYKRD